jgi:lipid-binding SYLF domain-containing protein
MHKLRNSTILSAAALLVLPLHGATDTKAEQRLQAATEVFTDMMDSPKGIPHDLFEKAHCVVIVPSLKKGAIIIGGEYGKGFLSCRNESGNGWSAPAAIRIEGGSVGLELGASEKDLILTVMNAEGKKRLLESQFTMGGEGEVAAGPVGRNASAQTDAKLTAGILSWSRSRGAFAGLALKGATLRQDTEANEHVYGKKLENREIVNQSFQAPASVRKFQDMLSRYSPVLKVS